MRTLEGIGRAVAAGLVVVGSAGWTAAWAADPPDPLLAEVRAAWEKRQKDANTVRVAWTWKDTTPKGAVSILFPFVKGADKGMPPADAVHDGSATLLLDGPRMRLEVDKFTWDAPTSSFQKKGERSAYDGNGRYTALNIYVVQSWPSGIIRKEKRNPDGDDIGMWPMKAGLRGTDSWVMNREDLSVFTAARRTTLDGRPMVELVRERTEVRGEQKCWVDPAQDYAARRDDMYDRDGTLQQRITISTRKDPSGLWIPSAWKAVIYRDNKLVRAIDATLKEFAVNIPTSTEDFTVAFPVGTKVRDYTDELKPREYILREDKPAREVLPHERGAPYDDLVHMEAGDLSRDERPSFLVRNRAALFVGGGLFTIALAVLVLRQARRPRAPMVPPSGPGTQSGGEA